MTLTLPLQWPSQHCPSSAFSPWIAACRLLATCRGSYPTAAAAVAACADYSAAAVAVAAAQYHCSAGRALHVRARGAILASSFIR